MTALIETRGLARHFGGLKAVDGVDFTLQPGEIRAVIGPNGAGKTTFVSLLSGRIAPSAGTVRFDGRDITSLPAHARVRLGIAYTFQITSVYPKLSVWENVALALRKPDAGPLGPQVAAILREVGLETREETLAGSLSYGHQRLLELAMGLALHPRLLILDEPTQGLSDGEIENFVALVRRLAENATVLLIEHNMAVVMALATRITVLERGRILAEGDPQAIRADEAVQRAYLGAPAA
ncbi:MAG: ABC transporter ATP-binding protein [Mesorhizobium amorphae]|nr:MAG: ABC transporter ATP-binding protein [Mesorhizobium amorphae]